MDEHDAQPALAGDDPVVGIYDHHLAAEQAVKALGEAGFPLTQLSIIGKGYRTEEHAVGFYTAGDRIKAWGGIGGFWGALWGLVAAPAILMVPTVGIVATAGPIGVMLIAALESAILVGGLSALAAALVSLGMSKDKAVKYEAALRADKFLIVVHGTAADAQKARSILAQAATSQVANETSAPALPSAA